MSEPILGAPPDGDLESELADAVARLDDLVTRFEAHPHPDVRDGVAALLQAVDTIHRIGLTRLAGELEGLGPVRERLLADPALRLLLELYELAPPEETSAGGVGFVPLSALRIATRARP